MATLFPIAHALAAIVAAILAGVTWRRRDIPGAVAFFVVLLALTVWSSALLLELLSATPAVKESAVLVEYAALITLVLGSLRFASAYTGRPHWAPPAVLVPLAFVGVVSLVIIATNDLHHLHWREIEIPARRGPTHVVRYGPWFFVHSAWAYAVMAVSLGMLIGTSLRAPVAYRRQLRFLSAVVALPIAANAAYVFAGLGRSGYDPTSIALSVSAVGIAITMSRFRLLDFYVGLVPVARDAVVDAISDGVVVVDRPGRIVDMNVAAARAFGCGLETTLGMTIGDLLPSAVGRELRDTWRTTIGDRAYDVTATAVGGDGQGTILVLRDVTEQHAAEIALRERADEQYRQARQDILTGLPNRLLLFERLSASLTAGDAPVALAIIDLDGFKSLNDTFGHRAGDTALRLLGPRLAAAAGAGALVARLGGDEFAVVATIAGDGDALALGGRLASTVAEPMTVDGHQVALGASVGVAVSPRHGRAPDELVHAADVAMYEAKRTGLGVALYDPELDLRTPDRLLLAQELRAALDGGQIRVLYQPQVDMTGRVVGVEALVRWEHPERGLLDPGVFLPLAEQGGYVRDLTRVVLETACRDAASWSPHLDDVRLSVNITGADVTDGRFVDLVLSTLAAAGLARQRLTLELSENAVASLEQRAPGLVSLRTHGVRIALDDFGTGTAPISLLRELAVDEIKLDYSFVRGVATNPRDASLVTGLVRFGHGLGALVVAEGVESAACLELLKALQCDAMQGFAIGRPMSSSALVEFAHNAHHRAA